MELQGHGLVPYGLVHGVILHDKVVLLCSVRTNRGVVPQPIFGVSGSIEKKKYRVASEMAFSTFKLSSSAVLAHSGNMATSKDK